MKPILLTALVAASLCPIQPLRAAADSASSWPAWRGPLANGFSATAQPPLNWGETNHVKWKAAIPGFGTSTPVVWGDKVFILTAIKTGVANPTEAAAPAPAPEQGGRPPGRGRGEAPKEVHQFVVLCLDRQTGKTLWQKVAREEVPHEGHHQDHGFASASPITDGERLLVYFGSRGLYCYDLDGNLKWEKQLGRMRTRNGFGEGASPALSGKTVVINWDDEGDGDFIAAFDRDTGAELWKVPRNEPTGWSTPLIVTNQGARQVVVNATGKTRAYDLATGKPLWELAGQTANAIPTPVALDDTVIVTSGFRGNALQTIKLGRTGDLAGTDAVKSNPTRNTPYVPSPLLVGDLLYTVTGNNGVVSCFDARTGETRFEGERLEGVFGIYASPVATKDRVYVLGREGLCLVLKAGPKPEILAKNKLDDRTDSSIALAGRDLFIRGHKALYCIAEP